MAKGSDSPAVFMAFFGGVANPGGPAAEDDADANRLAAGRSPDASLGSGSIGIGGIVDLDEFDVDGVGRPWSGTTGG